MKTLLALQALTQELPVEPEEVETVLGTFTIPEGLADLVTAIALVATAAASIIAARRTGRIETATDGAATRASEDKRALLKEVEGLREELAQLSLDRKDEREASQRAATASEQAASDVRAERAAPAPVEPKGGR